MSSIIDALKKSDNNRSTESGANLNQIKFGNEPPPKSRRGFWLLVVLLLLVAFGVLAWTQGWHHSVIAHAKSWLGAEPVSQPEPESTTTVTTSEPTADRSNKLTPPKPDEVKAKSLATDQAEADKKKKQQLEAIAAGELDKKERINEDTKPDETAEDEIIQIKPVSSSQADEADDVAEKSELLAQQNRKDLEPTLKQDYLLVHQIDFEIRKNIPSIKLNIHIFDPDPENRMVILNGVKYATGDSIEDLVTVEEINQAGVVLQFEGVKFLIPK